MMHEPPFVANRPLQLSYQHGCMHAFQHPMHLLSSSCTFFSHSCTFTAPASPQGWDVLLEAYLQEFRSEEGTELHIITQSFAGAKEVRGALWGGRGQHWGHPGRAMFHPHATPPWTQCRGRHLVASMPDVLTTMAAAWQPIARGAPPAVIDHRSRPMRQLHCTHGR